jgi:hypothetical protein
MKIAHYLPLSGSSKERERERVRESERERERRQSSVTQMKGKTQNCEGAVVVKGVDRQRRLVQNKKSVRGRELCLR